jgi:hypothetical protein
MITWTILETVPNQMSSTFLTRARGASVIGSALFIVFEGFRRALYWPVPCEAMLESARTDARVVAALGGPPVRLAHPFWSGDVSETSARVTLPLRGAGDARATLEGDASRAADAGGKWRVTACRVRVGDPGPSSVDIALQTSAPSLTGPQSQSSSC